MEDTKKEIEQKISQLQLLEQNLQNFLMQKQNFQAQLLEIENALAELEHCKGETYKIIGPIMIATEKENLKKDLTSKKEIVDLRIKNLKKQEELLKDKAKKLQEEVIKCLKGKNDKE
ncbi:prefoldin subunit beta [Candidatus Woesearchaeota archaeon]|nr:prefoldin subunit beta [Candidatus Woesearchaeota archaeon]